jgi:hypothetical protein
MFLEDLDSRTWAVVVCSCTYVSSARNPSYR